MLIRARTSNGAVTGVSRYSMKGSAYPIPHPVKLYPLKVTPVVYVRDRSEPVEARAVDGLYLRVSAVRRLRARTGNPSRLIPQQLCH